MIHRAMNLVGHRHCTALSSYFRGQRCDQLMNRPGRPVTMGPLPADLAIQRNVCSSFGRASTAGLRGHRTRLSR